MAPRTQYAHNGEVSIAYQVHGRGPLDLVIVPGFISHLELDWMDPRGKQLLDRLGSFCRVIRFDKRGTGLSDPVAGVATLEERMEDVHAVMDAAGSRRATLLGASEGGPMAALFAATYPERTTSLVLYGSFASGAAFQDEFGPRFMDVIEHRWGEGALIDVFGPSVAHDEARRKLMGTYERAAASPGMARALVATWGETDVSAVLANVGVPTLVIHRRDEIIPIGGARAIAEAIPGAQMLELEGVDHLPFIGDGDAIIYAVEEFLTGSVGTGAAERTLATVVFTDIVGSTELAGKLGDSSWRGVLERHDELVGDEVAKWGGRVVKHTGDGALATFDGPARAVRCAAELHEAAATLDLSIRAGVHTGEIELIGEDVGGMAVHIAARITALADAGEVLASSTVKDLIAGSGITFVDRGERDLKGVPDRWQVYRVADDQPGQPEPIDDERLRRRGDRAAAALARRAPSIGRAISRVVAPSSRRAKS
jgi:class 3 adenylate cyclase/pimeloyl-ACP methyl ester carboxylesterase